MFDNNFSTHFVSSISGPKTVFFWAPAFKWVMFDFQLANALRVSYHFDLLFNMIIYKIIHSLWKHKRSLIIVINSIYIFLSWLTFFFIYLFLQSLVIAGLGDLSRPANQLSIGQSASLFATGVIWSRYSLVIIPKNYSLFSVNVFVALTQLVQLTRAYKHAQAEKALESTKSETTKVDAKN